IPAAGANGMNSVRQQAGANGMNSVLRHGGDGRIRVVILSFLFNWPSTGGGIVHTVELAQFLIRAGYEVLHVYAHFEPWGIGRVEGPLPYPAEALHFDDTTWNVAAIQNAYRRAVAAFNPDHVLI